MADLGKRAPTAFKLTFGIGTVVMLAAGVIVGLLVPVDAPSDWVWVFIGVVALVGAVAGVPGIVLIGIGERNVGRGPEQPGSEPERTSEIPAKGAHPDRRTRS